MSFHGVPRATLDKGDPYHCECQKTGRLLAEALGLKPEQYRITFQSRFGRAEWLKPYTADVLAELGKQKAGRVDVICPGFVSDCLETLEEIAIEGKAIFLAAGGREFHLIPCLNERNDWIHALADIVLANLVGWADTGDARDARDVAAARARHGREKLTADAGHHLNWRTTMRLLLVWIINALSLLALPYLFDSIRVDGFYTAMIVALVLGLVNAVIRPLLVLLTLPITILTLGLFIFVINGLLFWFVASFVEGFTVSGFWPALFGAIAYSIISWLCSALILGDEKAARVRLRRYQPRRIHNGINRCYGIHRLLELA